MQKSKGNGIRYETPGAAIEREKNKTLKGPRISFDYRPKKRFCECCRQYKPRKGPAIKPWHCDECKQTAAPSNADA